jgi:demethylmenaquinone methyltransferase/2-methoxy-6-polyprenyl-1,4-benzoquinol methylase
MFAEVAPRYDLLNRVLSAGIDRTWRRAAVRHSGASAGEQVLDVCAGTGDLTFELAGERCSVVGADFCPPMLALARAKGRSRSGTFRFVAADALSLPFPDRTFDLVTVAFGLRNLADPARGLREVWRVLRPGGRMLVLEFARPRVPILGSLYYVYFRSVLPRLGSLLNRRSGDAYRYLHRSVMGFPERGAAVELLEAAGFTEVGYRLLTLGIAALYLGRRPAP